MLKLVMATSADRYVAKGPHDDMSWCPKGDKQLFRVLTGINGTLGAGRVTAEQLPRLPGRTVVSLSNSPMFGMTLGAFAFKYPGAWLLGGQTIALEALSIDLVDEVHLVRNNVVLEEGVTDLITPWLRARRTTTWSLALASLLTVEGNEFEVEVWRRGA